MAFREGGGKRVEVDPAGDCEETEGGWAIWGETVATGVCAAQDRATALENKAGGFGVDSERGQGT